ncbi:MAG TPA: type II toxin-antitoxin system HicB family antitoxin [Thermoanaerobaculia bacterium]|nr:type II toxin-antitoxin system HicB family antitoxin [Thermoanaerobaculia bacterium]
MTETLEHYLSLGYPYELVRDEGGVFVASHPDLPGCLAQGETANEAVANLDEARQAWIGHRFESGLPIPEPVDDEYSGKFLLRMSPSLHSALAREASRQQLSLNQFISNVLAEYLGGSRVAGVVTELLDRLEAQTLRPARRATQ